jgi:hypothetical protein
MIDRETSRAELELALAAIDDRRGNKTGHITGVLCALRERDKAAYSAAVFALNVCQHHLQMGMGVATQAPAASGMRKLAPVLLEVMADYEEWRAKQP